jgi:hypothetical protein
MKIIYYSNDNESSKIQIYLFKKNQNLCMDVKNHTLTMSKYHCFLVHHELK